MTDERITHRLDQINSDVERMAFQQVVAAAKLEEAEKFIGGDQGKLAARIDKAADAVGKVGNQLVSISEHTEKIREFNGEAVPDDIVIPDPPNPDNPPDEDDDGGSVPDETDDVERIDPPVVTLYDGSVTDFHTAPKESLAISARHPRLLLNQGDATPDFKMIADEYKTAVDVLRKRTGIEQLAWQYRFDLNQHSGELAKQEILNLPDELSWKDVSEHAYGHCIAYDWCHDLFTAEERKIAFRKILMQCGMLEPDGTETRFIADMPEHRKAFNPAGFWISNDAHEPRSHSKGYLYRLLVALAFHGDGVADEWCDSFVKAALGEPEHIHQPIYRIYDPVNGGVVDGHNVMALNTGGCQAGHHSHAIISGYNKMFTKDVWKLLACWDSAMGDDCLKRSNLYRYMADWLYWTFDETEMGDIGGDAVQILQMCTGVFPESRELSQWLLDNWTGGGATSRICDVASFVLSDFRTMEFPVPDDHGMIRAFYKEGMDGWYSPSGYRENQPKQTQVRLTGRYLDTNRHEQAANVLRINHGQDKVLIAGQHKKGWTFDVAGSSVRITEEDKPYPEQQQLRSRYANEYTRSNAPLEMATNSIYRGVEPSLTKYQHVGGHAINTVVQDCSKLYIDALAGTYKSERAVMHIGGLNDEPNQPNVVIVRDRIEVPEYLQFCVGWRVMEEPTRLGGTFWEIKNGNTRGNIEFFGSSPIKSYKRGGETKTTEGPNGESYDKAGYYFKDDLTVLEENEYGHSIEFGKYSIYVEPEDDTLKEFEFVTVIKFGPLDATLPSVSRDGEYVTVGDLVVNTDTMEVKG